MAVSKEEFLKEQMVVDHDVEVIRKKISELGQELYDRDEKVLEFKKFMWDNKQDMDPAEMRTMMSNNDLEVNLMMKKGAYLQKIFRIQNNPFFGSITYHNEEDGTKKIYIGITHLEEDLNYLIHDWRSPICSMFYDYEVGKASYVAPDGKIDCEILNKRQYKIENAIVKYIFDNNLNIDDDVLQEVLGSTTNDKMKNIVNTIQKEQNEVIRNTNDKNLIVQGIAGSGKTSVALHRIAFLLYKLENLTSNNILILSPNKVFSEYISNVLPELGEDNTIQSTFHDFASSYIKEYNEVESFADFLSRYYKRKNQDNDLITYKLSNEIISDMESYINDLTNTVKFKDDLLRRDYSYSKEELDNMFYQKYSKFPLFERLKVMSEYIAYQNFNGKIGRAKTILKELFELIEINNNYKDIYINFFDSKYSKYKLSSEEKFLLSKSKIFPYENSFIFIYMKSLLEGFNYNTYIKEVVIDEAQDYSLLQYFLLKKIFKNASFTILGDVNQTINPYYKYDSLEEIEEIFNTKTRYLTLTKTYRSSKEIIDYSNKILGLNHIVAVRKSMDTPVIFRRESNNLKELLLKDYSYLQSKYKSVAFITKNDEEASYLYELLNNDIKVNLITTGTYKFTKTSVIVPAYLAKGLEFDSVIIYTDPMNPYNDKEKYLYYVACTRSQHELIIYNQKEI